MESEQGNLLNLPSSLLEDILLLLNVSDIVNCGTVSTQFKAVALSNALWRRLLQNRFKQTDPRQWLTSSACGHFELVDSLHSYPDSYRTLYPILREYEQMVGVWTDMDRSALCVFSWRPDCIQGTRLVFDSMTMPPLRAPFQRLASDGVTAVRIMDEKHCWLKEYKVNGGHLVRSPSAVAEAAASVAVGGGDSSKSLGSSPKGSFEHEMLRFMQMNVSGKRRKSRPRSPGQAFCQPDVLGHYHLARVPVQPVTRAHPLNGLWKGDFKGRSGVQVISITYDFSQRYAVIKAYKTGSQDLYPKQPQFMASAQAMSFPYSARDAALIANRLHYLNLQDAVAAVPLRLTSSSSQPSQMSQLDKEVEACYRGKGRLGVSEEWTEGRLFQYTDGSIGFLWILPDMDSEGILVDLVRIDEDLLV